MEDRTVFDTNIWISYFLSEKFSELIKLRRECSVLFLRSTPSLSELKEVITRKKFKSKNFNTYDINGFQKKVKTMKNIAKSTPKTHSNARTVNSSTASTTSKNKP